MKNFWSFLGSLVQDLFVILTRPTPPLAPVVTPATPSSPAKPDVLATLTQLILSQTESLGPMPGTGGVIHTVSATTAATIASLIVEDAQLFGIKVSLVASLIRGESDFDPAAIDPNDQDAKPGETAAQAVAHTDFGIEQEDGATAIGDPQFAGFSLSAIEAKLLDPVYGVRYVVQTLADNINFAQAAFVADPSLAKKVPNGDPTVLACEAYNAGQTGALHIAHTAGAVASAWAYGLGVVTRAATWSPLLDV
jgi:hypothetical protein